MPTVDRRHRGTEDLAIVAGWALLTVLAVAVGTLIDHGLVSFGRALVAGAYLLFVPGYAFLAVLFPETDDLSLLERGAFSVGASLGLVGLLGIPLDVTPWGVRLWTVLLEQAVVVAVLLVSAAFRRSRLDPADRAQPFDDLATLVATAWARRAAVGGGNRILQIAILVAVVAAVGATTYTVATPLPSERFTELYVLGPDGTVEGVPANATAGEPVELTVGVTNHEHTTETYGIQVQVSDAAEGDGSVRWTTTQRLAHNETWETTRAFDVPAGMDHVRIRIVVFRGDPPGEVVTPDQAYRSVGVVLTVDDR
jgi:uncharacterized membrane protein